jgi:hypothetical protein
MPAPHAAATNDVKHFRRRLRTDAIWIGTLASEAAESTECRRAPRWEQGNAAGAAGGAACSERLASDLFASRSRSAVRSGSSSLTRLGAARVGRARRVRRVGAAGGVGGLAPRQFAHVVHDDAHEQVEEAPSCPKRMKPAKKRGPTIGDPALI